MEHVIEICNLTRDFGYQKGVFDVSLSVKPGEVFGFLGPNGAGKTTTIRHLLGFMKANIGSCQITGLDCFRYAPVIQENLGYLAGEIAFPEDLTGEALIRFMAQMKQVSDYEYIQTLMELFELDPRGRVKKMSKGMKQKLAIVCAFMKDPQILILDEPTSGLDPLMQNQFIELIQKEKKRGKTIFMSSHLFEEVERTCDRVAFIRQGEIAAIEDIRSLQRQHIKNYQVTFADVMGARMFLNREPYRVIEHHGSQVTVRMEGEVAPLLATLSRYHVKDLDVKKQSMEEKFLHLYGEAGEAL